MVNVLYCGEAAIDSRRSPNEYDRDVNSRTDENLSSEEDARF